MRIASTLPQLGEISCSESSHVPRPIRTREEDPSKFVDCQSIRLSTAFISSISQRRDTMIWPNSRVTCPLRRSPPPRIRVASELRWIIQRLSLAPTPSTPSEPFLSLSFFLPSCPHYPP